MSDHEGRNQAVIKERDETGDKAEHHYTAATGVWQGSTLRSATLCSSFSSRMADFMNEMHERSCRGIHLIHVDDFIVCTKEEKADEVWRRVVSALRGLLSFGPSQVACEATATISRPGTLKHKAVMMVGTKTTERKHRPQSDIDRHAGELADHVDRIKRLHIDTRKREACGGLWYEVGGTKHDATSGDGTGGQDKSNLRKSAGQNAG